MPCPSNDIWGRLDRISSVEYRQSANYFNYNGILLLHNPHTIYIKTE